MNVEEFKSICQNLNWEELKDFLSSSVKDLSLKIFVTALFQCYHPDEKIKKEYGLNAWDDKLSNIWVSGMASLFTSRVNLYNLYRTWAIAPDMLENSSVQVLPIQTAIRDYIYANKINLSGIFIYALESFSDNEQNLKALNEMNDDIKTLFPDIKVLQADCQAFDEKVEKARQKIEEWKNKREELMKQTADKINLLCKTDNCLIQADGNTNPYTKNDDKLFKLREGTCDIWQADNLDKLDFSFRIEFGDKVKVEKLREYFEILEEYEVDVNFVNFPTGNGYCRYIQLMSTLEKTYQLLP